MEDIQQKSLKHNQHSLTVRFQTLVLELFPSKEVTQPTYQKKKKKKKKKKKRKRKKKR